MSDTATVTAGSFLKVVDAVKFAAQAAMNSKNREVAIYANAAAYGAADIDLDNDSSAADDYYLIHNKKI